MWEQHLIPPMRYYCQNTETESEQTLDLSTYLQLIKQHVKCYHDNVISKIQDTRNTTDPLTYFYFYLFFLLTYF